MLKTKTTKTAALLLALVMAVSVCLAGCSQPSEGAKDITVRIVYADGTSENIDISTDKEYLADALVEEGIIEYDESGFYTTVKGVTADYSVDGGWWCLTKDGVMTTEGFNTQAIADGDKYEITYTKG